MRYIFDLEQLERQGITVAVNPGSGNVTFEDCSNGFPIFHNDCFGDLRNILGDEKAEQVMEKAAEEINGEIFHAKLSRAKRKPY
jgi:hypothetical protein